MSLNKFSLYDKQSTANLSLYQDLRDRQGPSVLSPSRDGLDVNTEPGWKGDRPARLGLFGKSSPCYVAPAKRICLGQATKVRDNMNAIRETTKAGWFR